MTGPMPLRSLIVEDDPVSRTMLRLMLQSIGIEVAAEVSAGRLAIDEALARMPDLVCLDIGLPDIDGILVLQQILAAAPRMQVVMVTASSDRERVREALSHGAAGYVVKPYAKSTVLATLQRLFPQHRLR